MQLSRKRFATLYYSPVFVTLEIRLQLCLFEGSNTLFSSTELDYKKEAFRPC